ncbi:MAG: DUF1501 domain-containing protein [Gemmataceae bacterium]
MNRRDFLAASAALLAAPALRAAPKATADACIFLWLGGGAAHIDTFDPKRRGDAKAKKAGSAYAAIDTAVPGVRVCEHLPETAKLLDRCALVRTLHHNVIDEHAAAVHRLHTGRTITETVIYPSVGSVVSHQLGARGANVPPYVVIGYPNVSRGPGFLGTKYGYVYLTETDVGPAGLIRPRDVNAERQARREELLVRLRDQQLARMPDDKAVAEYATAAADGFRLAGPDFMKVFDLKTEPPKLRSGYGGEFGQRCLLARRLVEAGVRFVEVGHNLNFVNGTGWDTHNEGQEKQHELIQDLDMSFAALLRDLEARKRLDKTLVVIATEFGRPPEFDARGGRGHYSKAFSGVLAGGGLRTGRVIGVTDELGKKIEDQPVSIPDFHATIYAALGIDPAGELFADDRPVPITDHGVAIRELFA